MASDEGLTTWALSPSASCKSTGRMAPRLERGGPKPAARPASRESAGTKGTSTVPSGSCASFMVRSPRFGGAVDPGSGQRPFSRDNSGEKMEKSGKGLQQAGRLLLHVGRAAGVMEGHHLQQGRPKLLTGPGIGAVQLGRGDAPALRDGANGNPFPPNNPQGKQPTKEEMKA